MPFSTNVIRLLEEIEPSLRKVLIAILEEIERQREETITRREFLDEFARQTEENFQKVWQAISELAEAQKRTEEELRELIQEHKETRKQLGGLAMTVGYSLENEAYRALPELLKRGHAVVVKEGLKRAYIKDQKGNYIEVNIIGDGKVNGKRVKIVGEGKAQLSKTDVDTFVRRKLRRLEGVFEGVFPVLVTHMTSSHDVEDYALKKGIRVYYSYEF